MPVRASAAPVEPPPARSSKLPPPASPPPPSPRRRSRRATEIRGGRGLALGQVRVRRGREGALGIRGREGAAEHDRPDAVFAERSRQTHDLDQAAREGAVPVVGEAIREDQLGSLQRSAGPGQGREHRRERGGESEARPAEARGVEEVRASWQSERLGQPVDRRGDPDEVRIVVRTGVERDERLAPRRRSQRETREEEVNDIIGGGLSASLPRFRWSLAMPPVRR